MNRNRVGQFIQCATALFAAALIVVVSTHLAGQQEQQKKPVIGPNDLCPSSLVMQFGDFYYYDCFKLSECNGVHSHLLAGNTRPHSVGCAAGDCDELPGPSKDVTKKADKKNRNKVLRVPGTITSAEPSDENVRATIFVHNSNVTYQEEFAKYVGDDKELKGKTFRVVRVSWPTANEPKVAIICHECDEKLGSPANMFLIGPDGGEVKVKADVGPFKENDIVEIVVFKK